MAKTRLEPTGVNTSASFTFANLTASGNVAAGNIKTDNLLYSNGAVWSIGGGSSYSNTNVASYLPTYTGNITGNIVTLTGNVTAINANLGNLVVANYISGNGSLLTSITGANVTGTVANATYATSAGSATTAGTVTTAAQPNITSVGILNGLAGSGTINLIAASNVSLGSIGNVHITGGSPGYVLQTDGSGALSWTAQTGGGSVTASPYVVKGTLSADQNLNNGSDTVIAFDTKAFDPQNWFNTTAHTVTPTIAGYYKVTFFAWFSQGTSSAGSQYNIQIHKSATGGGTTVIAQAPIAGTNAQSMGVMDTVYMNGTTDYFAFSAYSSIASQYLQHTNGTFFTVELIGSASATSSIGNGYSNINIGIANANIQFGVNGTTNVAVISNTGITITGNISASGNVTAAYLIGNGSALTSITGGNVTGQVGNALVAGTVYTAAQPNITSVGTLSTVTVTANVDAGNIRTDHLLYANGTAYAFTSNASGSNTQIQFNDSNAFAGSASLTFNKTSNTLTANNFIVSRTANLGAVGNVTITGGTVGQVLSTDGAGVLSWSDVSSSSGTDLTITVNNFTGDGSTVDFTLGKTPASKNFTIVSVAGVLQPRTTYSVSGSTLTFSSAPPNTAPIEVSTFTGGGGSGSSATYSEVTSNTTAAANNKYIVDTSTTAITITLPSSGTIGDEISIIDGTGNASTHNITIGRNGGKIQGAASDMTVSVNRAAFTLVYYNSTQGWLLTNI